jgi:preprotein translocase subunit SecF
MKLTNIDFMRWRFVWAGVSAFMVLLALISLGFRGLNLGLDFTGGTLVEVAFPEAVDPEKVRGTLVAAGFQNGVVQYFGTEQDLLIRMPPQSSKEQANMGDQVLATLATVFPGVEMRQSNFVGPAVGEELTEDAGLALLAALAVIMIYILFRFTKQFAIGAVVALIHDVIITLGVFSFFHWTFDL